MDKRDIPGKLVPSYYDNLTRGPAGVVISSYTKLK